MVITEKMASGTNSWGFERAWTIFFFVGSAVKIPATGSRINKNVPICLKRKEIYKRMSIRARHFLLIIFERLFVEFIRIWRDNRMRVVAGNVLTAADQLTALCDGVLTAKNKAPSKEGTVFSRVFLSIK